MWKCQVCETINEGNVCSVCGNVNPEQEDSGKKNTATKNIEGKNKEAGNTETGSVQSVQMEKREIGVRTVQKPDVRTDRKSGRDIELMECKRNKRRMSIAIICTTVLLIVLSIVSHWTYKDGSAASLWHIIFYDAEVCHKAMIDVGNIERVCTVLLMIFCICPCIISFLPLNVKQRDGIVIMTACAMLLVTVYCGVIVVDTLTDPDLSGGIFPWAAPVLMLMIFIFVWMKMKALQDIENYIYRPVMYGADRKFS